MTDGATKDEFENKFTEECVGDTTSMIPHSQTIEFFSFKS